MIFLEYIWVDREGMPRSKTKVQRSRPNAGDYISSYTTPTWNFDGSSTGQNYLCPNEKDTEVVLKPVRVYESPLDPDTYFVLCDLDLTYDSPSPFLEGEPRPGFNTRRWASRVSEKYRDQQAWFGAEQEYSLLDPKTGAPFNWLEHGKEGQGNFYCSVGYPQCQLNEMAREHMHLCAKADIKISGINAEVAPSQWEFQIGPDSLLKVADDLIMARYLLLRLSTKYQVKVTLHPKPMKGEWNGSGCHLNFSTKTMRDKNTPYNPTNAPLPAVPEPMDEIMKAINNLEKDHPNILLFYGEENEKRLTGKHETSNMKTFSYGVGTRHTSVRIPNLVARDKKGYVEDRRPASNIDPYLAMGKLLLTIHTGDSTAELL